jgi:hypothetical protein
VVGVQQQGVEEPAKFVDSQPDQARTTTTRSSPMPNQAKWFTVSRTETVQPYAVLSRDGLVELLARFGSAGAAELAGRDDTTLLARIFRGMPA